MELSGLPYEKALEPLVEAKAEESDKQDHPIDEDDIKEGGFHKWLGKPEDEEITEADIEKGLASDDAHVRKMANFAKSSKKWHHAEGTLIEDAPLSETAAAAAALIAKVDKGLPANAGDSSSTFVPVDVAKMGDEQEVNELQPPEDKPCKVPADVMAQLNQRIAEVKASIEKYHKKGFNDTGYNPNGAVAGDVTGLALEALEQIKTNLSKGEDGFLAAQIFLGTLMNPITNLFPPKLIKFLANPMPPSVEKVAIPVKEGVDIETPNNENQ
jgi:hypothetical protein